MSLQFPLEIIAVISGILTVLAPCVLPLLPIIIGGSIGGKNKWYPYAVTASLAISTVIFTLLLKVSTVFIGLDPVVWKLISGGLVLTFGLIYLFPSIWDTVSIKFKLGSSSDKLLHNAKQTQGLLGAVLTGAALTPVFASCSPTYSLIIATILPVDLTRGILLIFLYALGLAFVMLCVALLGRSFIQKTKFFANPSGVFKKSLGVIFVIVGLSIITGLDKTVEIFVVNNLFFDVTQVEQQLLNSPKQ